MNTPLDVWELPHRHVGRRVLWFDRVGSTNDLAAEIAQPGWAVLAMEQTLGRGQYGRRWQAPAGSSVLMSLVVDPPDHLRRPATLTAWAAVAVANTIDQLTGKQASLKWPNDVYVNSRKVCGVLIEHRRVTVAGIGLNLNQNEDEFKANGLPLAGSLAMVAGKRFDAVDVTRMLLAEFDQMYDGMVRDSSLLESNWRERLSMMDRHVVAESFDGTRHRGVLRVCSFEKLTFEHADGSTIELPPEQVRALSSPLAA